MKTAAEEMTQGMWLREDAVSTDAEADNPPQHLELAHVVRVMCASLLRGETLLMEPEFDKQGKVVGLSIESEGQAIVEVVDGRARKRYPWARLLLTTSGKVGTIIQNPG